jgi:hypothetical protein
MAHVCLSAAVIAEHNGLVTVHCVHRIFDVAHQQIPLTTLAVTEQELLVAVWLELKGVETWPHEEPTIH